MNRAGKRAGKQVEASLTAQWVAAARTVGALLPSELVIARDPFGLEFARGSTRKLADLMMSQPLLARTLLPHAGPLTAFLLWMQLRTRALDDILLDFVRADRAPRGRQVVLLGAGYDCRALRFAAELAGCTVFEIDHPATQQVKMRSLPVETFFNRVVYVPFDFERDPLRELPARLHAEGLDANAPTLTIWEGVTMYLSEPAIEAALAAIRSFSRDSRLAMTYLDRRALERQPSEVALSARLVARVGEPWRFGWRPAELPAWLAERGFRVLSDEDDAGLAARLLPERVRHFFAKRNRHLALVRAS
jgi:methyltransferase (TIGR00027 family)